MFLQVQKLHCSYLDSSPQKRPKPVNMDVCRKHVPLAPCKGFCSRDCSLLPNQQLTQDPRAMLQNNAVNCCGRV